MGGHEIGRIAGVASYSDRYMICAACKRTGWTRHDSVDRGHHESGRLLDVGLDVCVCGNVIRQNFPCTSELTGTL